MQPVHQGQIVIPQEQRQRTLFNQHFLGILSTGGEHRQLIHWVQIPLSTQVPAIPLQQERLDQPWINYSSMEHGLTMALFSHLHSNMTTNNRNIYTLLRLVRRYAMVPSQKRNQIIWQAGSTWQKIGSGALESCKGGQVIATGESQSSSKPRPQQADFLIRKKGGEYVRV